MLLRALLHPRALVLLAGLGASASCAQAPHAEEASPAAAPNLESAASSELPAALPIRNFLPLSERAVGGGPPSAATIAEMKALGYSTIINMRGVGEPGVAEEAELARAAGLHYVHIPIDSTRTNLRNGLALSRAMEGAPDGNILVHCGSGNRVGAMWGMKEAIEAGLSAEEAAEIARRSGMRSNTLEARLRDAIPQPR